MNKTEYYIWLSEHNHYNDISESEACNILKQCEEENIKVLNIESDEYPDSLRVIEHPPLVLFCLGDVSLLKDYSIAIVGTRRASAYGKWVAHKIAKEIALAGITHVSGMAWGIDSCTHEEVLSQNGKSIAVLGTGVDVCYPKSSAKIYSELIEKGLVVSEYSPGTQGKPYYFPERNRIISALSEKLIVVEGSLKSGSLITAKLALEQGKDIYAVPGNINQPNSIGCNILISDGAIPVVDLDTLFETLGLEKGKLSENNSKFSVIQTEILKTIKENGSLTIEELSEKIDMPINYLLSELSYLEILGFAENNCGIISL